ncbi:MAG: hypothetical protein WCX48_08495 [Bacteroidales bacterium]
MIAENLVSRLKNKYPDLSESTLSNMIEMGIIDNKTCIIMLIKNDVNAYYKAGLGKRESIQLAADYYGISYDTALNYVYKRKDIKTL